MAAEPANVVSRLPASARTGFDQFSELVAGLARPEALQQLGAVLACVAIAWGVVHVLRTRFDESSTRGSIWFGRRVVDGVLFPVLAVGLAFTARLAFAPSLGAAVFRVAIPVLLSLTAIRLTARVLTASFPTSRWVLVVERSVSWLAWLAVVAWITGLLPLLLAAMDEIGWTVGAGRITLRTLVEGALTAALVLVIALWIAASVEKRLLLRGSGKDLSIRKMAANIVRTLLLVVGLLLALTAVGIDLTALSVLGGAIGVGLGFGLQKIAANYISGFVILAERSLRIGDMVRVDGFEGCITDIRTRYTVIRALNGRESVVPNEMLITQRVENASLADPQVMISTTLHVAYGTDVTALQPKLAAAVAKVPRVLDAPAPAVQLASFAADGYELAVVFWIRDPEKGQANVRSEVNLAVLAVVNAEGIEIPFQQRVAHHLPLATNAA